MPLCGVSYVLIKRIRIYVCMYVCMINLTIKMPTKSSSYVKLNYLIALSVFNFVNRMNIFNIWNQCRDVL